MAVSADAGSVYSVFCAAIRFRKADGIPYLSNMTYSDGIMAKSRPTRIMRARKVPQDGSECCFAQEPTGKAENVFRPRNAARKQ